MRGLSSPFKAKALTFMAIGLVAFSFLFAAFLSAQSISFVLSVGAVLCLCGSFYYQRETIRDIKRCTHICQQLSKGNFESRLTGIKNTGEINDLMWSVNEMADQVDAFIREATASMDYVSRNLYFRKIIERGMHGSLRTSSVLINKAMSSVEEKMSGFDSIAGKVNNSLNSVAGEIKTSISSLQDVNGTMSEVMKTARTGSENAMRFSEETSMNVQTISSAAEEMSSSIAEISQQMNRTSQIAQNAVTKAEESEELVVELANKTQQINDVIALIENIANQTNLLALNATIEAARAGEAGKGFAIVANEVKDLAAQTSQATDSIREQITDVTKATEGATIAFSQIGDIIQEIEKAATIVAAAIEEQDAASCEIASNAEQTSTGTQEVAENVNSMGQDIAQVGSAADQISSVTDKLTIQSSQEIEKLLGDMKEFMVELKKIA